MKRRQKSEQVSAPRPRKRDVAHIWQDKRIIRYFRKTFPSIKHKNIKDTYIALCEIDSDFHNTEGRMIPNLTHLTSKYADLSPALVTENLKILKGLNLIDYGRKRDPKTQQIIGSFLQIFLWDDSDLNSLIIEYPYKAILRYIKDKNNNKDIKKRKELNNKEILFKKDIKESSLKNNEEGIEKKIPLTTYKKNKESYNPYSKEAKAIFAYWNKLGKPLTRHTEGSKVHRKAMKDITQALKKYSVQEINKAILNYYEILLDTKSYAINLLIPGHRVGMDEFFGFSGFTKRRMETRKVKMPTGFTSWFKTCRGSMEEWRKETKETPESIIIKKAFKKEFLTSGRVSPFTVVQEEQFLMAGRKLKKYYSELQPKFSMEISLQEFAEDLMTALREAFQGATVGNLVSNYTWSTLFPEYINKQNMIFEED